MVLPRSLDYTSRDFDALRARLIALVRSVFPDWSDFSVASFGNVLIEMYAFVGDVLGYYLDAQARESRLVTATQRRNVIALARMLGYRLHGARAAMAEVVFTLAQPAAAAVRIPAGTVVRTREVTEPVRFQLMADVVFAPGQVQARGAVEHSTAHTELYDLRGLPDLDLVAERTPFLDGSASVVAGNGSYTEVESLLGSGPNDRHFVPLVDQNDRATLRFGNGASGAPPTGTLRLTYRTGGGPGGNVEANQLVVLESGFQDAHGRAVQVSVSNPAPAAGGLDRQSIASAREGAPLSLRTLTRSITREDFEINALRVPGVARTLMLTSNEDPGIGENSGILYVVPIGGGAPTPALKNAVRRMVTEVYPCPLTFQVSVQDPLYRVIDIDARLFLRQGTDPNAAREQVGANLQRLFRVSEPNGTANRLVDFGFNVKDATGCPAGEVAWSDVCNAIRDTTGVRKLGDGAFDLRLNGLPEDVRLRPHEFPTLGAVVLLDGDRGGPL